jgi:fumarate reductase iron-sulfur subunit
MMDINICQTNYTLEAKIENLLDILFYIKKNKNTKLAFRNGCRSGVCGSCAVVVDGVEKLACKTTIKNSAKIEPLRNHKIIRDLVVDLNNQAKFLQNTKAYLKTFSNTTITQKDQNLIDTESNCILCSSCISSCPVYSVNSEFLSPLALTRVYRYTTDKKEKDIKTKIDSIQKDGIWDCTLCGNCNMVCPSKIDIKGDIMKLRNLSAQFGYNDPNMQNMSFDFGFNPNGL